jgi:uncharacterized protein
MERKGDWIKTYSGVKFYPFDPRPEEVCLDDIAHALSNICRFTGHTNKFYSVAQHSVLVSEILSTNELALAGLFHDASEAYICDIARPIKKSFGRKSKYMIAEQKIQSAVYKRYHISISPISDYAQIKLADDILLFTEGRDLMNGTDGWWNPNNIKPLKSLIHPLSPLDAEDLFIARYKALTND